MAIDRFLNICRMQAAQVNNGTVQTTLGTIVQFDPTVWYAIVQLYDADPTVTNDQPIQSPWLPVFSPWVGNGWGLFMPPSIGDLVEVHFQEGSLQNGYIGMRSFQPGVAPLNTPSGEAWLVHSTGSYIKLTNDGNIAINSSTLVTIGIPVQLGDPDAMGGFNTLLTSAVQSIFNTHTHDVSGGGVTLVPNQLIPDSALTTNVTAN